VAAAVVRAWHEVDRADPMTARSLEEEEGT